MNEKIKCIFGGFVGGLLLCLGFTWGKKNNAGNSTGNNSTVGNSSDLIRASNYITDSVKRDADRLLELTRNLKEE